MGAPTESMLVYTQMVLNLHGSKAHLPHSQRDRATLYPTNTRPGPVLSPILTWQDLSADSMLDKV